MRAGGARLLLPHEFPPSKTVFPYCREWRLDGTWERIHTALRERPLAQQGRDPQASAGISGRQSTKTTSVGGVRGYAGGKQVKGRKRHLLVDTESLVLAVTVHPVSAMDRDDVKLLLAAPFPRSSHVSPMSGSMPATTGVGRPRMGSSRRARWRVNIVKHRHRSKKVWVFEDLPDDQIDWSTYLPPPGFRVLLRRWVVVRTLG